MKCNIDAYIIYYVEPIAICQEKLLLLLSDVGAHQEEESAPIPAEQLAVVVQGVAGGAIAVSGLGEAVGVVLMVVVIEAVAQPYLQGRERQ
jgi:hypothetical protein